MAYNIKITTERPNNTTPWFSETVDGPQAISEIENAIESHPGYVSSSYTQVSENVIEQIYVFDTESNGINMLSSVIPLSSVTERRLYNINNGISSVVETWTS